MHMILARCLLGLACSTLPLVAAAQDATPAEPQEGWSDVLSILVVILVVAVAAFLWFMRQRSRERSDRNK